MNAGDTHDGPVAARVQHVGCGALTGALLVMVTGVIFWPLGLIGLVLLIVTVVRSQGARCGACGNAVAVTAVLCPVCRARLVKGTAGGSARALRTGAVALVFLALAWGAALMGARWINARAESNEAAARLRVRAEREPGRTLMGARLRIVAAGPDGTAGFLLKPGGEEVPVFVVDLVAGAKGGIWTGTLYECGRHVFAASGREVMRCAAEISRARELWGEATRAE